MGARIEKELQWVGKKESPFWLFDLNKNDHNKTWNLKMYTKFDHILNLECGKKSLKKSYEHLEKGRRMLMGGQNNR